MPNSRLVREFEIAGKVGTVFPLAGVAPELVCSPHPLPKGARGPSGHVLYIVARLKHLRCPGVGNCCQTGSFVTEGTVWLFGTNFNYAF